MRIPSHIMIHHSLTKDGSDVSAPAIYWFHVEKQGWRDIGYHALVEEIANVTLHPHLDRYRYGAIIGRPIGEIAAACPEGGMNVKALHVCCVGNYDLGPPPLPMLHCLINRVLVPWMSEFGISPENIVGHRDYNPHKTCPGTRFDLELLRRMVR